MKWYSKHRSRKTKVDSGAGLRVQAIALKPILALLLHCFTQKQRAEIVVSLRRQYNQYYTAYHFSWPSRQLYIRCLACMHMERDVPRVFPPSFQISPCIWGTATALSLNWQLPQNCRLEAAVLSTLCVHKCLCYVYMHSNYRDSH